MERIDGELKRELGRLGPAGGMTEIVAVWPRAVGEAIARQAWPARLARDGTLHVAVSSSLWAFELTQLERRLAARLAEELGEEEARKGRIFAPGRLPGRPPPVAPGRSLAAFPRAPEPVETGPALTGSMADPDLGAVVAGAAARSLARAAARRRF